MLKILGPVIIERKVERMWDHSVFRKWVVWNGGFSTYFDGWQNALDHVVNLSTFTAPGSYVMGYDEALFQQECKRRARFGAITEDDVVASFWTVAPDLLQAIREQNPSAITRAEVEIRANILPGLTHLCTAAGLRIVR